MAEKGIDMENQKVECTIKRDGITEVMIEQTKYPFYPNQHGHFVCEVPPVDHRRQLYITPGCFRPYNPKKDYPELFGGKKEAPAVRPASGKAAKGGAFESVGANASIPGKEG